MKPESERAPHQATSDPAHAETLARSWFRAANDAYFLIHPHDQRIVDVNPTAVRLTSFEHKELCGLKLTDLFSSSDREGLQELARAFHGPQFFHSREGYFLQRKGNAPLAVNVSAGCMATEPVPLGLVMARDVQERKKLVESLQLLQFSLDQSSIATLWIGQDAGILHVNQAVCRMLGYAAEELFRLRTYDICPDCVPERCAKYWQDLKASGTKTFLAHLRARDGRIIPVEVTAKHLEFGGRELQFSYVQDISARLQAEEERRRLEERVAQAQKLESLGVMAGGIAHDFNNRLTVILGNALLAQTALEGESPIADHLRQILQASKSAADLCQHLLAYTGKSSLARTMVPVNALVEGLEQNLSSDLAGNAVFRYELADPAPVIQADEAQLRQALGHLVVNAAEALSPAGGTITISTGSLEAGRTFLDQLPLGSSVPDGLCAWIEVTDNGAGMDADTTAKMFEPFFSTKFIGRGLGLSFVFGTMRGHRGAIQVTSQVGKGTSIRLLFPMPTIAAADPSDPPSSSATVGGDKGVILVVEDEPTVRGLIQHVLEGQGYRCLFAADGVEAIHVFRTHHRTIDMVLLDLTMPRMDGEAAFHELRALDAGARVVLCTGYDARQAANRLLTQGISGVLQKPYTPTQLVDLVQTVLQVRPEKATVSKGWV